MVLFKVNKSAILKTENTWQVRAAAVTQRTVSNEHPAQICRLPTSWHATPGISARAQRVVRTVLGGHTGCEHGRRHLRVVSEPAGRAGRSTRTIARTRARPSGPKCCCTSQEN